MQTFTSAVPGLPLHIKDGGRSPLSLWCVSTVGLPLTPCVNLYWVVFSLHEQWWPTYVEQSFNIIMICSSCDFSFFSHVQSSSLGNYWLDKAESLVMLTEVWGVSLFPARENSFELESCKIRLWNLSRGGIGRVGGRRKSKGIWGYMYMYGRFTLFYSRN